IGCRTALVILVMICRAVYIFVEQSGGKRLKETEQYPAGFGRALALRHAFGKFLRLKDMKRSLLKSSLKLAEEKLPSLKAVEAPLEWSHAKLDDLRIFLREQAEQGVWRPKVNFGL
ncbi:unnamed protein product, partial [Cladocopium goreaui]